MPTHQEIATLHIKRMSWQETMAIAVRKMLSNPGIHAAISEAHVERTPERCVAAFEDMFSGCYQSPSEALSTLFDSTDDEMIYVKEMSFYSTCAHHLVPFFGMASFAYIPDGKIVGLSKIPRLLEVFSRRPQVQEQLTSQMVDAFQETVKPRGCAIMIRAYHLCCMSRGVKQPTSYTQTTGLRGNFKEDSVKSEFLHGVSTNGTVWK